MGADARAYLYYGIPLSDIYVESEEDKSYEIHDIRTGKPTGEMATEKKMFFVNKHSGKKYLHERESLGIKEQYIHRLDQDSNDIQNFIIAVCVCSVSDDTGGTASVSTEDFQRSKDHLDLIITQHLLIGNGLCAVVHPKLMLNLYWSY